MNVNSLDSPETFFQSIPKDLNENLDFRVDLHTVLEKDKSMQGVYLGLCLADPKIAFNSMFWTKNPRKPPGYSNLPFILRPKQEFVVDSLFRCIMEQRDFGINKSRDEGATEMVCKLFALLSLQPERYFIVGSRNKELVDSLGDPYTLFAKIDYAFEVMPPWLKTAIRWNPKLDRKDLQLVVSSTGSVIKGETTNESFSAGRRGTAIFLDEFGRVEPRAAKSIEGSIHDVTGCVIYGSTHWFGEHHPFNVALKRPTTTTVNLVWYENPEKAEGLYKTPEHGIVEIVDTDYYKQYYPEIPALHSRESFKLVELESELLKSGYKGKSPTFVADGCENLPKGADVRSPWHDTEEAKREGDTRDFISNVWASPIGAQDSVFSHTVLNKIETSMIRPPRHKGDISFEYDADGKIVDIKFVRGGREKLLWWGELINGKPNTSHNYVIGCDVSLGTGNSNSVAAILDVHTSEVVGTWVCPHTPYERFADTVYALGVWANEAYVVFENSGGHGINFGRRLAIDGYRRMYTQRSEDTKSRHIQNKWGWNSSPERKADLLGELGISLSEGLKTNPTYRHIIIHDKELLRELYSYVYYTDGDIGCSEHQDLVSGARKRHGDRVIGVALCNLGAKYQQKVPKKETTKFKFDSPAYRKYLYERELEERKITW